jgi:hypothetical protein
MRNIMKKLLLILAVFSAFLMSSCVLTSFLILTKAASAADLASRTVTQITFDPNLPPERTATILFWLDATEYNGISIREAWYGAKNDAIPLIDLPAGPTRITWIAHDDRSSLYAPGIPFEYNFEGGKSYTVIAKYRNAQRPQTGKDCFIEVYNQLPKNVKKPEKLKKSSLIDEIFIFNYK